MADYSSVDKRSYIEALPECRTLRWYDHPQAGRLTLNFHLTTGDETNLYDLPGQSIVVDVAALRNTTVGTCSQDVDVNFSEGASVLRGESDTPDTLVHLSFNPPVKAVGTFVTGQRREGGEYEIDFKVAFKDGSTCAPFVNAPTGIMSSKRDTAPFVGAVAGADNPIADMYCSIRIVGPAVATRTDVLISDLYFVPTNTSNP